VGSPGKPFSLRNAPCAVPAPAAENAPPTYSTSGVDRAAVHRALAELLGAVRYRAPSSHGRVVRAPGHYAGLFRLGRETIAVTTDTVGTKVLLSGRLGRWEEVGEDVVAINVNDLAAVGARPAGVVDTILCGQPDPTIFRALGRGIERGLAAARCSLLGGETAVVGEIVRGIDLGATAVGFFPPGRRPILGNRIRPGDRILGIPSSGFHANGFTLIRRLVDEASVDLAHPRPGATVPVGAELLLPTRTYTEAVEAVAGQPTTHGLAHVSGGGVRNLPRLHARVRFVLGSWPPVPELFRWLQKLGGVRDEEMFQTFNMGIGFVVIVAAAQVPATLRRLARAGAPDAVEIGRVEAGRGVELPQFGLRYEGYS
jgi:phosphoribosylformylglycinamidine cyclo-ligase